MNDSFLQEQGVSGALIESVRRFRESYPVAEGLENRMSTPEIPFFGKEILEMAIAALLQGENLLLTGEKATGKNVLAETLAYVFGRPTYNVSFHVNTGSAELIGTDTFQNQEVTLRKGSIYRCAEEGGFGILDEINMAKNDAVSVLHAALDYRRIIDVPGYDKIPLHPAARMIGTMNYGYAGTRELNEALVSRFLVIDMPSLTEETLFYLMQSKFPDLKPAARDALAGLYLDLQKKAKQAEITTRAERSVRCARGCPRILRCRSALSINALTCLKKRSCGMLCARGFRKSGRRRIFFRGNTYGDRGNIKNA